MTRFLRPSLTLHCELMVFFFSSLCECCSESLSIKCWTKFIGWGIYSVCHNILKTIVQSQHHNEMLSPSLVRSNLACATPQRATKSQALTPNIINWPCWCSGWDWMESNPCSGFQSLLAKLSQKANGLLQQHITACDYCLVYFQLEEMHRFKTWPRSSFGLDSWIKI